MRAADRLRTTDASGRDRPRVTETGKRSGRAVGKGDASVRLVTSSSLARSDMHRFYDKRRDFGDRHYEYRRVKNSPSPSRSVFGARLRLARLAAGLPQDKLGVKAGLDEGTASARISRYESGIHEPNVAFANRLAEELRVPLAYFYSADDDLAKLILWFGQLDMKQRKLLLEYASRLKATD
ncbi:MULTISPECIES: helix-turn-helix domain-containing protein [unclassified Variovorax]|uniref:helix-turn-helix domain-containing protein n=1 Tax=unclassified Variovorax TaxID=663243 RepID=UPI002D79F08E|nr:helix-turn-helix transcriptional regulator [Variovorax sp. PMC12]